MYQSHVKSKETYSIAKNNHFNIVDILLLDHSFLKECIDILSVEGRDKKITYKYARYFLDALKKHSIGEKKALYAPLKEFKELRFQILEKEIEHGIVDLKVKSLTKKLAGIKSLTMEMEAELHVLAGLVERHVDEEEQILFPLMRKKIDKDILNQMGYQFMIFRQFTEKDLADTELKGEIPNLNQNTTGCHNFIKTTHEYFSRAQ